MWYPGRGTVRIQTQPRSPWLLQSGRSSSLQYHTSIPHSTHPNSHTQPNKLIEASKFYKYSRYLYTFYKFWYTFRIFFPKNNVMKIWVVFGMDNYRLLPPSRDPARRPCAYSRPWEHTCMCSSSSFSTYSIFKSILLYNDYYLLLERNVNKYQTKLWTLL